jgi:hypothetical protein
MATTQLIAPALRGWALRSHRFVAVNQQQHQHQQRRCRHASRGDASSSDDNDATPSSTPNDTVVDAHEKAYVLRGRGAGAATRVTARMHTIDMDVPKPMGGRLFTHSRGCQIVTWTVR